MTEVTELPDGTKMFWAPIPKKQTGKKVLLVIGEIFITLGLVLALFVGYKAVLQDSLIADSQIAKAQAFGNVANQHKFRDPAQVTKQAQIFGRMYVPRFGSNWTRLIAEGTRWHPVLNDIGVGHYVGTAMPGEVGNFAVAAHRGGFGGSFKEIHRFVSDDKVYVETRNFWYVYKYLQTKIVNPNDITVIQPVPPELDGSIAGSKYMTMTSCTPIFVNTQRIIVWLELDQVIPIKDGPPQELELGGN
jgi:sortase A